MSSKTLTQAFSQPKILKQHNAKISHIQCPGTIFIVQWICILALLVLMYTLLDILAMRISKASEKLKNIIS